jgi:hypothetical protein
LQKLASAKLKVARLLGLSAPDFEMSDFVLEEREGRRRLEASPSDLVQIFLSPEKRLVHKWDHYLPAYDQHFGRYRGTKLFFLEIGVSQGGSLDMWRSYFGPDATIVGVDINPSCSGRVSAPNVVRIGSQDDPAFLSAVLAEFGEPDVVLDDGSHIGRHQVATFDALFPKLQVGGLYAIEDLHTSYWLNWEGGYRRRGTGIELVKQLIDDQHGWYHRHGRASPARDWIPAIHVYDSLAIIEKAARNRPGHVSVAPQGK